ncbi:hypothetical protein BBOV_II000590 [Babesia bovis T2Bo]|uniref:Uncharacterized protein n=1 Tax=Babesia bovis TaxID=5865 RepID=A7ASV8_BABBO|nr:hypothetical protein BBOV_II000590 [Babesia bovis T2Bo]EDO06019.1 hypothetical protein BBOV_II000590 [Babesia bovis T2Bo]|eukprot:XP_001609587.1 hypothetical protein [Babesia bovis T2Bo]
MVLWRCVFSRRFTSTKPSKEQLAPLPTAPPGRRPIGYRGNHLHKKDLYDPVYPTTKVPSALIPRFPLDWRNAGRFLLTAALAKLESRRILRHSQSLRYQEEGPCGSRCSLPCSKSSYRCLCAWRATGYYAHSNSVDNILVSFKGPIVNNKLFTVPRPVAKKNPVLANRLFLDDNGVYRVERRTYKYPVFSGREVKPQSSYHGQVPEYEPTFKV